MYRSKVPQKCIAVHRDNLEAACIFCNRSTDDELIFGKFYTLGDISCHYFCVLLSCCAVQNGKDNEGLFGFLYTDIVQEAERGKKYKCSYCGKRGATLGCIVSKCRKQFHLPCGRERNAVSIFHQMFHSYCEKHAPRQAIPPAILANAKERRLQWERLKKPAIRHRRKSVLAIAADSEDVENGAPEGVTETEGMCVCVICYCPVEGYPSPNSFWPPCCARDEWFHRQCLQRMALSAGMHYLKCPLCNEKDTFFAAVMSQGIYIPDRDAAWELEQNAFASLYERPKECVAEVCKCTRGRNYDGDNGEQWELQPCLVCGSVAAHGACGVRRGWRRYVCPPCTLTVTPPRRARLERELIQSTLASPAEVSSPHQAAIKPSHRPLRSTRQHPALSLPTIDRLSSTPHTSQVSSSKKKKSVAESRLELNLKAPRVMPRVSVVVQDALRSRVVWSPIKLLDERWRARVRGMDDAVVQSLARLLRERIKKPLPLSVKKRIVNQVIQDLLSPRVTLGKIKDVSSQNKVTKDLREMPSQKMLTEANTGLNADIVSTDYATMDTGKVSTDNATMDTGKVSTDNAAMDTGKVSTDNATMDTGKVSTDNAAMDTGKVSTDNATMDTGKVSTDNAAMDTGKVSTDNATMDTGKVSTDNATMENGKVATDYAAMSTGVAATDYYTMGPGIVATDYATMSSGVAATDYYTVGTGIVATNYATMDTGIVGTDYYTVETRIVPPDYATMNTGIVATDYYTVETGLVATDYATINTGIVATDYAPMETGIIATNYATMETGIVSTDYSTLETGIVSTDYATVKPGIITTNSGTRETGVVTTDYATLDTETVTKALVTLETGMVTTDSVTKETGTITTDYATMETGMVATDSVTKETGTVTTDYATMETGIVGTDSVTMETGIVTTDSVTKETRAVAADPVRFSAEAVTSAVPESVNWVDEVTAYYLASRAENVASKATTAAETVLSTKTSVSKRPKKEEEIKGSNELLSSKPTEESYVIDSSDSSVESDREEYAIDNATQPAKVQSSILIDDSSTSTFELPSEFVADRCSDDSMNRTETPKKPERSETGTNTTTEDDDKSMQTLMRTPVKPSKCVLKFSPLNTGMLSKTNLDIDLEDFKDRYLTEVERGRRKGLKRKRRRVDRTNEHAIGTRTDEANGDAKKPMLSNAKESGESKSHPINQKSDAEKRRRKRHDKREMSIMNRDIKLRIKWKEERINVSIDCQGRPNRPATKRRQKPNSMQQMLLGFAPNNSSNHSVIVKPEEPVEQTKRKYEVKKHPQDSLRQTSLMSYFQLKR